MCGARAALAPAPRRAASCGRSRFANPLCLRGGLPLPALRCAVAGKHHGADSQSAQGLPAAGLCARTPLRRTLCVAQRASPSGLRAAVALPAGREIANGRAPPTRAGSGCAAQLRSLRIHSPSLSPPVPLIHPLKDERLQAVIRKIVRQFSQVQARPRATLSARPHQPRGAAPRAAALFSPWLLGIAVDEARGSTPTLASAAVSRRRPPRRCKSCLRSCTICCCWRRTRTSSACCSR